MSPETQRIAIAEACGFINVRMWSESCIASMGINAKGKYWGSLGVPDYLNDLNAMHEAEKALNVSDEQITHWQNTLELVCDRDNTITLMATAAQRAEAFLKTIDKWKEKENER